MIQLLLHAVNEKEAARNSLLPALHTLSSLPVQSRRCDFRGWADVRRLIGRFWDGGPTQGGEAERSDADELSVEGGATHEP